MSEAGAEWRDHWRVVLGSGLGVAAGFAPFAFVASLFVKPLEDSFGWSRGTQALVQNIYLGMAFLTPFLGVLVDRIGVRRVALASMPVLALGFFALALTPDSLAVFFTLMAVVIIVGQGTTGLVYTRAVVGWFHASRGTALAVSRFGISAAAAVLPLLVFWAISSFGWRAGYVSLGLVSLVVGCGATWLWVREAPEARAADRPPPSWNWVRLLREPRIVILCLATSLTIGPVVGFLSQMQPLLTDKHLAPAVAASMAGVLALSVVVGTIATGLLIDRVWAPLVGCAFTLLPVGGCLLLLDPSPTVPAVTVAIVMIGLAQGAELDLAGFLIARYFGIASFAAIFGLNLLLISLVSASCSLLFGLIYDWYGNYDTAIVAAAALLFVAAVLYPLLGRYPPAP